MRLLNVDREIASLATLAKPIARSKEISVVAAFTNLTASIPRLTRAAPHSKFEMFGSNEPADGWMAGRGMGKKTSNNSH
jgi:hypothetical protein